nr:hypothetical protein [Tanacetum cinerariifolium]
MEVDIKEDENELELTFSYEEVDPFNPPPPASDSEFEDVVEVENTVEPEDEIVPASVHEIALHYPNPKLAYHNTCPLLLPSSRPMHAPSHNHTFVLKGKSSDQKDS